VQFYIINVLHIYHEMQLLPQASIMISLSVGLTAEQSQGGADVRLSKWLSNLNNIRRALAVAGADDLLTGSNAVVKWVQQPIVVPGTQLQPSQGGALSREAQIAIGVVVGFMGAVLVLGVVWGVLRQRRRRREEEEKARSGSLSLRGNGNGGDASERRRVSVGWVIGVGF
jgi:hypothetical protein